jgi:hypothetical protein
MASRPLAKALHTVTAVTRVALHTVSSAERVRHPENATRYALEVLGYGASQIDEAGDLFRACVAAVAKG